MSRLIDADNLVSVLDILCDKTGDIRYWEQLKWIVDDMPTVDPVKSKLQQAIEGKTAEEIYDFLSWLMFVYAKQYTDSRSAVIEWLKVYDAPTISPKRGRWGNANECSECGFQPWFERDIHTLSYCPNCGARMEEVTE